MAAPGQSFHIELAGPLDLSASLAPLGRWGDDGIDRWDGQRLLRVARLPTGPSLGVAYACRPTGDLGRPRLEVHAALAAAAPRAQLETAIAESFVRAPGALSALSTRDERIARLAKAYRGLHPVLVPDPLTALVRSISAQQVNLPWAAEIRRRLALRFGSRQEVGGESVYSLEPGPLAHADLDELRGLQLTRAKARSVIACARVALDGQLGRVELDALEDEQLIERLTRLPGIGRWSAEWFLARTLGRPRVVAGDLGVRKAVGRLYATRGLPTEQEVRRLTAHWGPAAALAQAIALHDLAVRRAD